MLMYSDRQGVPRLFKRRYMALHGKVCFMFFLYRARHLKYRVQLIFVYAQRRSVAAIHDPPTDGKKMAGPLQSRSSFLDRPARTKSHPRLSVGIQSMELDLRFCGPRIMQNALSDMRIADPKARRWPRLPSLHVLRGCANQVAG